MRRVARKRFAYAVVFLPKRLKLFAGVQRSSSSPRTGAWLLCWCYWEVSGSPKVFSPKVTVIAMVIERQAPESRSCVGTTRPFLLLVRNFSKYRPSRTSSQSQERIQGTAPGLNPFPHQSQARCRRLSERRLSAWGLTSFVPQKTKSPRAAGAERCVTQLFLNLMRILCLSIPRTGSTEGVMLRSRLSVD